MCPPPTKAPLGGVGGGTGGGRTASPPTKTEAEVINLLSLQQIEAGCLRRRSFLSGCLGGGWGHPPLISLKERVCGCRGGFLLTGGDAWQISPLGPFLSFVFSASSP